MKDDKKKKKRKHDEKFKSREGSIVNRKAKNSIYDIKLEDVSKKIAESEKR